ncbi:CHAT domain-containing protein [Microcystis aeruginosa]|nr:tetratricopeptide repeat protein [Microcystis aeruginosa]
METLRKISENPNPQVIYPFWAQNLDKLDDNLARILDSWAKNTLTQATPEQAYFIAIVIFYFSALIQQFPLGDIATHKEIAITGYEIALNIFNFDAFPQNWAMTQNNLAIAYSDRIRGEKAENLERAIAAYNEALKVYTFDAFPQEWAATQNNLANAYLYRIRGDKAENLERAITACQEALKVRTFEAFPQDWAATQNNLAIAYYSGIRGEKADNLERAIAYYQEALKVRTFDAFPQDWAATQNNLAIAYYSRIRGEKADNLERAIAACQEALKVYTFEAFPQNWAAAQNSLASAYIDRIRGEKADNLEKAIAACQEALKVLTFDAFSQDWASTQHNLATAYRDRIRGEKAENLERAIALYQETLKVYTFDAFPQEWAFTQHNLAIAYYSRIRGEKADNLERAIAACQEALKVYTFEAFPQNWAAAQNSLANAYSDRIRGEKADNLETAITAYQEALQVYTFKAFPEQWALIQNNLGEAYRERIRGEQAGNLEKAIAAYQEALKVLTFDAFPQDWAMTQNNLANAYSDRIRGEKADNLETAITAYQEALKVRTFDAFPQDWARTQHNLAIAYCDRIRGEKAENLERAIAVFQEALKVLTFDAFPQDWAMTQNFLATAYRDRIRGEKADNLERAITTLNEALKVYTFDAFPQGWARTQNNLGEAYRNRIRGEKAENLERAITAYNEALKVYTFDAFPQDWATTQNNLAIAYSNRIRGDKADNLEKAITSYQNALTIRTKEADPLKCLQTARNLAILHYSEEQWQPATEAYNIAIEAVENARLEALNPHSRQEVLSNAIGVFHRIVQAHLNLNQPEKALEYIERSKGRNLVELITQKNLHPQGVSQEIVAQLNELKQRVVNEQIRLQHQSINQNLMRSDNLTPYVQDHSYLKEYQQDLDNFIAREIKDPLFSLTQKVEPIAFTEIQAFTNAETCLLQWYITGEKILVFVVSAEGEVKYWQSSENDKNQLFDKINNYLQLYYSGNGKQEWRNQLSNLLQTFADILHINDILALIPDTCQRLIIIPHWFLHILPLHALPVDPPQPPLKSGESATGGSELQDLFPKGVQYAPSCQILQKISQTFHHSDFNKLFAIQNPTKDLFYTDLEVNILSTFFTEPQVIAQDNATKNAVLPHLKSSDNHCYHFSCHGSFNPANPLESALFLANKEPLTLGEIFELRLNKCRLITLSACETGMIDINSISDEYIGLPSGFLFAGSPSVVSSLWTVNDLSTSFLMIKLYEILFDENQQVSVPVALKTAQNWLQNLTVQEYLNQLDSCLKIVKSMQQKLTSKEFNRLMDMIEDEQIRIKGFELNYKLFNNPFYWAAFTASGI